VRATPEGVVIDVLVAPRASRSKVLGLHDGRVKIALAAPPVDGAANDALVRLLAELLDVPRRAVRISAGESARRKTVAVAGTSVEHALARLVTNGT
jgi:uncharacterized protein (TIGR00251 family)